MLRKCYSTFQYLKNAKIPCCLEKHFSQGHVKRHGEMAFSWRRRGLDKNIEEILYCEDGEAQKVCPQEDCRFQHLRCSRPGWAWLWVTCSSVRCPCLCQGLDLDDLWAPFQPKQFYDYMILWLITNFPHFPHLSWSTTIITFWRYDHFLAVGTVALNLTMAWFSPPTTFHSRMLFQNQGKARYIKSGV